MTTQSPAEAPVAGQPPAGAAPFTPFAIEATELVKRYDDQAAVNGVSLAVRGGEAFGLLGPNGAGKTVTVEAMPLVTAVGRRPLSGTRCAA